EPERVFEIAKAVREAVPASTPVTVKVRLGYEDSALFSDVAAAVISAGADELIVHARTKVDGYRPPAYWSAIAEVAARSPIPLIAYGEIWSVPDYRECSWQSRCSDIMLGRGLLASPGLARQIKSGGPEMPWLRVLELLRDFSELTENLYDARYVGNRVKQWLAYLRLHYRE